jgi:hypothetical protein
VERLYSTPHNLWKTGVATDLCYRDASIAQGLCGRAGRENLNAGICKYLTKLEETLFVINAKQCAADWFAIRHLWTPDS